MRSADAWIVFDALPNSEECLCPPPNVIFVTWEPPSDATYHPRFLNQFKHVVTGHRTLEHPSIHRSLQGHPWFVEKDYDTLSATPISPKTKDLCVISSDKEFLKGHRARLDFVRQLKEAMGDRLDVYGRGINPFESKWDTLVPYRYSVVIENDSSDDWITEKLFDTYLAGAFPIYYGAPNVHDWVEPGALLTIDIKRVDEAIASIQQLISRPNHYDSSLDAISRARSNYLNHLQTFPMMASWLDALFSDGKMRNVRLFPQERFTRSRLVRTKSRLRTLQKKVRPR